MMVGRLVLIMVVVVNLGYKGIMFLLKLISRLGRILLRKLGRLLEGLMLLRKNLEGFIKKKKRSFRNRRENEWERGKGGNWKR